MPVVLQNWAQTHPERPLSVRMPKSRHRRHANCWTEAQGDDEEPETLHARSVLLSDDDLGAIARIDLVEADHRPICHFTYGGWLKGVTTGTSRKNVELRMAQFRAAADRASSLAIAQEMVTAKIRNCRVQLRRNHPDAPAAALNELDRLGPSPWKQRIPCKRYWASKGQQPLANPIFSLPKRLHRRPVRQCPRKP